MSSADSLDGVGNSATSINSARSNQSQTTPGRNVCLCVTLLRHAETDMNNHQSRVLQGQADVPINLYGAKQSAAVARRLRKEHFDYIYTSDLTRAVQTAEEIKRHHANTEMAKDPRLREMDLGDLTGVTWAEAKKLLKQEDRSFQDHVKEKGEGSKAFEARVVSFYTKLINEFIVEPHHELLQRNAQREDIDALEQEPQKAAPSSISTATASPRPHPLSVEVTFPTPKTVGPPSPLPHPNLAPDVLHPTTASNGNLNRQRARRLKLKRKNILIVTHGGWIHQLLKHLLDELGFEIEGDSNQRGFPKNTGIYRFTISKMFLEDGDYEWKGAFTTMNSLSHVANIGKDFGNSSPGSSRNASNSNSPSGTPRQSPQMLRKALFNSNYELAKKSGSRKQARVEQPAPALVVDELTAKPRRSLGW
ncbi:hypothetical protein HK101_003730 [Irineochytrium annulatum]|nr:hypothetical protein HK101_003730 [Irineochytrium annulatum]